MLLILQVWILEIQDCSHIIYYLSPFTGLEVVGLSNKERRKKKYFHKPR